MSIVRAHPRSRSHELRDALRNWLDGRDQGFTHFVTLSTNDSTMSLQRARERLQEWDARLNREIVGARWQKRPDERIVWFAALEGARSEPHWHLLFRLSQDLRASRLDAISDVTLRGAPDAQGRGGIIAHHWRSLVPTGSAMTLVADDSASDYVTKLIGHAESTPHFVDSLELKRN